MNGNAAVGHPGVFPPDIKPLLLSFEDLRRRFPEILICGPREVNHIFHTSLSEDLPSLNPLDINNFLKFVRKDFDGEPDVGIFLTAPGISLQNLLFGDFGDNFYRSDWAGSSVFSGEQMDLSVILTTLESNPVFHGRKYFDQTRIARERDWKIVSAIKSIFILLTAKRLTGKRHKISFTERTSTVCGIPERGIDESGESFIGRRSSYVCVGEFGEVCPTGGGIRITLYGETALRNLGAAVAFVRRIDE